jgi:hypothetical protein
MLVFYIEKEITKQSAVTLQYTSQCREAVPWNSE